MSPLPVTGLGLSSGNLVAKVMISSAAWTGPEVSFSWNPPEGLSGQADGAAQAHGHSAATCCRHPCGRPSLQACGVPHYLHTCLSPHQAPRVIPSNPPSCHATPWSCPGGCISTMVLGLDHVLGTKPPYRSSLLHLTWMGHGKGPSHGCHSHVWGQAQGNTFN